MTIVELIRAMPRVISPEGAGKVDVVIQDENANLFHIKIVQYVEETGAVHLVMGNEVN